MSYNTTILIDKSKLYSPPPPLPELLILAGYYESKTRVHLTTYIFKMRPLVFVMRKQLQYTMQIKSWVNLHLRQTKYLTKNKFCYMTIENIS
jgi:hypothetical protein